MLCYVCIYRIEYIFSTCCYGKYVCKSLEHFNPLMRNRGKGWRCNLVCNEGKTKTIT